MLTVFGMTERSVVKVNVVSTEKRQAQISQPTNTASIKRSRAVPVPLMLGKMRLWSAGADENIPRWTWSGVGWRTKLLGLGRHDKCHRER